jgi:hypothetical protein
MFRLSVSRLAVAFSVLTMMLLSTTLLAQAPQGINYQAVARTADGAPLADTTLDVSLLIGQDVDLTVVDYAEIHSITTNAYGLFTLIIGQGAPTDGSFTAIDWTVGEKYLNVQVGTLDMGTTQLMSVPFALYAATSGNTVVLDSSRFDSLTNELIIYSNGDSAVADLNPLVRDEAIDTLILENDSALQIIEGGDTFLIDLSAFRNELSLDNDSTNELLDSITVDAPFLKFWAQGEADSISLLPLLFDNSPTNERISNMLLTPTDSLIISEGGTPSDTVDLSPLGDDLDFVGVVGDSLKFVFNADTIHSIALNALETGIDTSINQGEIIGTDIALVNNAGDTVFVDISSLATDSEVADIETAIYNEIDADSAYLNDSIDQVAADLIAEVNFLISELADDSTYLNDSIDQVATDLANYIATNIDTNITEGLIVGTDLALINNVGDTVFVDISSLATDNEVADIETAIYNEIDADSAYLNDSIDQVAADLIAEVNFLISELADDSTYLNDSIDQVAADLANYIATNIDTNITEGVIVGTDLALINNVGDSIFIDISSLATDNEVADIETAIYNEIDADSAYLNDSIDQVAANLISEVNFLLNELADDSTYLNDSIDQVAADLANYIATNIDTNITEGVIVGTDLALINNVGDSIFIDISSLATDIEVADVETAIYNEINADSTYLNDSIDQVALDLESHVFADADTDSTNELITQLFESGDSLYVIESGDTFALDLSGLSPDTLDRIVLNDSNLMIMQTGQVFVNFDNDDELTLSPGAQRSLNLNDIFIGNILTGQSDDGTYVENIGIGAQALQEAVNVPRNTAIGARSFQALTTGGSNIGVGRWSGVDFDNGSDNVMLGNFAGGAIANGNQNVFIGSDINGTNFGTIDNIDGAVRIGYQAGNLDSADNRLFIDNSNTNSPLIWGDFASNIMQIGGTFRVNNLVGDTLSYPTSDGDSGWVLQTDGAGQLSFTDFSAFSDNLGNHTLDSNLRLGDFYISKDGDDEGIRIDTGGNVGIGLLPSPSNKLRVDGTAFFAADPADYVTVQSYGGGFRVIDPTPGSHVLMRSDNGGPYYRPLLETETAENTAQFSSDHYKDTAHIWSTGDLVFNNGGYENATMILDQSGNLGIGTAETNALPISRLDVKSSSFLNTTLRGDNPSGTWLNIGNNEGRYYQLISTGSSNAVGPSKLLFSFGDTTNLASGTAMVIDSNKVGISQDNPQYSLDVGDTANIQTLQINGNYIFPSAAPTQPGQVISYDGTNLIWDTVASAASEKYGLDSVLTFGSNANNDSILNLGYLTLGTTAPAARIDVVDNTEEFSINVTNSTNSAADKKGVFSTVTGGGAGDNYGIYGESNAPGGNKFGVYGGAQGAGGTKYGIYGNAQGAGTNYAGYFDNGNVYIDGRLGISNLTPLRRLDITGDVEADSAFIDSLTISGIKFPDPNTATTSQMLTFNGVEMVWDSLNMNAGDSDWDTSGTGGTVFNLNDTVAIGASSGPGRFNVLTQSAIAGVFSNNGNSGLNPTVTMLVSNQDLGSDVNTAISLNSAGPNALFNQGMLIIADSADTNFAINAISGSLLAAPYALGAQITALASGNAIGGNFVASSSGRATGITATGLGLSSIDTVFGLKAEAINPLGESYAGYFGEGDVFIKDTLEVDSILKYSHSSVQQGFYLRTNADGTVYADTFTASTCPVGFAQVNNNFCIETAARTTETEWFEAADTCSSLGASLPTWMEWYTGTKEVVGVDYNSTQAWEWLDQASQNNASIAGGGAGATLEDRRKTISADNPILPSNTVQYRCVYRLK